jgi:aldose 1-epimerase
MHDFRLGILETDANFIPTGNYVAVKNTPFDFTTLHTIGEFIHQDNQQLQWNRGYNHCYVLKKSKSDSVKTAAILSSLDTGRMLTVKTDLLGIVFYSGGFLESAYKGKNGEKIKPDIGVCLEAQFFPDTPSHPHFPSCLLRTGEEYAHTIEYRFGCNCWADLIRIARRLNKENPEQEAPI